jgi:hypothetical protein
MLPVSGTTMKKPVMIENNKEEPMHAPPLFFDKKRLKKLPR